MEKIYRQFLASYLCVCLIPLLLSLFTIVKLEKNVQDSIIRDQESVILDTQHEVDRDLSDAVDAASILSKEAMVKTLAQKQTISGIELHDLCKLIDVFSTTVNQKSAYYRGFCYFYRNDFLVSNIRTYHPEQNDLFAWDLDVESDAFYQLLQQERMPSSIQTIFNKEGEGYILVLRNVYDSRYTERLACVGIVMQVEEELMRWRSDSTEAFVMDKDGQLIYGGDRAQAVCAEVALSGVTDGQLKIDGDDYLYTVSPSKLSGMQYGFLTMKDIYYESIRALRFQMLIEIIVYFAVGILIAVFLSRKTWTPFESVLPAISSSSGETQEDEYKSMKGFAHALKGLAQEKQSLENRLEQTREQARIGYIARYLNGTTDDPAFLSQYIEEGQPYRMLLFSIIEPEKSEFFVNVPQDKYVETMESMYYAVRNILEEIFFAKQGGVSLEINDCLVMLVQGTPSRDEVRQAVKTVQQALSLPITCYMSDPCLHLTDAPSAWRWIERAYHDDLFWQSRREPGVWMASRVLYNKNYRAYGDFLDHQKKLAGYLESENYPKARKCLQSIIDDDLSDRSQPFEIIHSRYAGVAELLLSHLPEEKRDIAKGVPYHTTADEIQVQLLDMFDQVQGKKPEAVIPDNKNTQWAQEVQAYICGNYYDPALNASMIAEHFSMNLSTLSRRYKNTVGHGVLDEVHMVRLEAAKKLLEAGVNVRETAERTGYVESRAMIRAFKRYEGVTPGQYADKD